MKPLILLLCITLLSYGKTMNNTHIEKEEFYDAQMKLLKVMKTTYKNDTLPIKVEYLSPKMEHVTTLILTYDRDKLQDKKRIVRGEHIETIKHIYKDDFLVETHFCNSNGYITQKHKYSYDVFTDLLKKTDIYAYKSDDFFDLLAEFEDGKHMPLELKVSTHFYYDVINGKTINTYEEHFSNDGTKTTIINTHDDNGQLIDIGMEIDSKSTKAIYNKYDEKKRLYTIITLSEPNVKEFTSKEKTVFHYNGDELQWHKKEVFKNGKLHMIIKWSKE